MLHVVSFSVLLIHNQLDIQLCVSTIRIKLNNPTYFFCFYDIKKKVYCSNKQKKNEYLYTNQKKEEEEER